MSEKTLAERIKAARIKVGIPQSDLAMQAGITVSGLAKLEQGVIAEPGWWTIVRLAAVLGVDVGEWASADPQRRAQPEVKATPKAKRPSKK
jgi:transcriptional regulator with XRE-family HTH domain